MYDVYFDDKVFTLISEPRLSGRLLNFAKNYDEVSDGELYAFELLADVTDDFGNSYLASYIFSARKGVDFDLSDFDLERPDNLILID